MKRHLQCAEQQVSPSNLTKYCACHTEWLACLIVVTYETSFTMRGATGVTIQPHQIPRLPHRMTRMLDRRHIWNVIYNARSNRCHHPTSPNTAPATKNDSTALSSSHMKRHFQCAEQQVSLSNLTKYCACHEKWHCKISKKISKNRWNVISNAGPIRPWSEHDPRMIRAWKRKPQPASQVRLLFEVPRSIFYCKIQRFAPNLTFKPSPNTAPAAKSATWTSPNTCACHEKCHLNFTKYCACHEKWHLNFTKYCACHEKWHLNFTKYCACHEMWHLNFTKYCACHEKWHLNFTKYCACHEKWHLNFTKYCACHEKWHLNFTKYCACHEKWHLNFTKYCTCHEKWHFYSTWLTLLDLLYLTLLYLTLLYLTLLYLTLFYLTLLYLTLLYLTLLYLTLLYLTLFYLTLLYLTYSTWLYSTWHYSTWLYSTWLYSTWLNFTEMSFVYRKFLS